MKAVIYSPGIDDSLSPLTRLTIKPMIPILNRPMMLYQIDQFKKTNITEIAIILHRQPEQVEDYFHNGRKYGVNISYFLEKKLNGNFRSLENMQGVLDSPFVFYDSRCFNNIDLSDFIRQFYDTNALFSLAVVDFPAIKGMQSVVSNEDGLVNSITKIWRTEANKRVKVNTGLYCIKPELLEYLQYSSINSIEDDLIPELVEDGANIFSYKSTAVWDPLREFKYYLRLNQKALNQKIDETDIPGIEIKPRVKVGKSCKIKTDINNLVEDPVLIGKNTVINKNVTLNGPVIIGNNVKIDEGAVIDRSIIFDGTYIGKFVELKESVAAESCHIIAPELFNVFVEENFIIGKSQKEPFKMRFNKFLINSFDRIVSLFILLCSSPLFLFILILIKLNSKGPVYFAGKQSKRPQSLSKDDPHYQEINDEPPKFYFFRTVNMNDEQDINEYQEDTNYHNSPFYKSDIKTEVTSVGKFLRKSGLDKLPLFINVIKGDISLVGMCVLAAHKTSSFQESAKVDKSEAGHLRFDGRLSLAGFWQLSKHSNLVAKGYTGHSSYKSALSSLSNTAKGYSGVYSEFVSFKGYRKILFETLMTVIKKWNK